MAFPELVYKDYNSCQGCHVSPAGGGILTKYGKMFAAESLSTWGESSDPVFPDWFNAGANARYARLDDTDFPMVADLSFDLQPVQDLHLVLSVGSYSRENIPESREAYLLGTVKITKDYAANLRIGKFMVNYGLMTPDHTRLIRRGHKETINFESSLNSKYGALFFTGIIGETNQDENLGLSYKYDFEAKQGYSWKAEAYLAKGVNVGYSMMNLLLGIEQKHSHAVHINTKLGNHAYYWGQANFQDEQVQSHELGVNVYKGFLIYSGLEVRDDREQIIGLRWFPYSGIEYQVEGRGDSILNQIHLYF